MGNSSINRILSRIVLFWIILLIFPNIALAIDYCDFTSQKEECRKIMAFPWPSFIKEKIMNALFYDREIPNHNLVLEWNKNLNFNFNKRNSGVIRDAYVKLISISPSVILDEKLCIADRGKILEKHGYRTELPEGDEGGDCRTEYGLREQSSRLRFYINGKYFSSNEFFNLDYSHLQPVNVKIEYDIDVDYVVDHYDRERYCADWKRVCKTDSDGKRTCRRECADWDTRCRYDWTENRKSRITLYDSKDAHYFKDKPVFNLKVLDKYFNTLNAGLTASDFSSLELNFPRAFLKQFNYFYSLDIDDENVLTLKAEEKDNFVFRNLIAEKLLDENLSEYSFNFHSQDQQCEIIIRDHFFETRQKCNLDFTKKEKEDNDVYNIDMDKLYPVFELALFFFIIYFTFKVARKFSGGKYGRLQHS